MVLTELMEQQVLQALLEQTGQMAQTVQQVLQAPLE